MNQTARHHRRLIIQAMALGLPGSLALPRLAAAAPSPMEIVEKAEEILWGKTVTGEYEIIIKTPTWTRSLSLRLWMDRPEKSFTRILAPAKDAGISFLRLKTEFWNYLPSIERTIKIPPSLMLQPWLGSDFTNDDLVKESSLVHDYIHSLAGEKPLNGEPAWQIEGLPKPEAAVVWGKIVYTIRKSDFAPLQLEYYDERGDKIRTLSFTEFQTMDGRLIPTRWVMQPTANAGKNTTFVVKAATYNRPIAADVFSLRNLTETMKK